MGERTEVLGARENRRQQRYGRRRRKWRKVRVLNGQKAGEKGGKGGSFSEEAKKTETGAGSQEPETASRGKNVR